MAIAASHAQTSLKTIDDGVRSSFESLLRGDIHAYATGTVRDIVFAYRAKRITVNGVSIDCDGLAMTFEVWHSNDVHYIYSLTMPLTVTVASGAQNEFKANCDTPDCVKSKLSTMTPSGEVIEVGTANFLQVITRDDEGGSRAARAFRNVRESCGGTQD
jgi:hypothetical protein